MITPRSARVPLLAAWWLIIAFATAPAAGSATAAQSPPPRLASLEIDIWPDYDRRAALVILKAELAPDVALPAAMSIRIPASSGGPAAVAFADEAKTGLFNLQHERSLDDGFVTLRFQAPQRRIHVEFYDPIATENIRHSYRYVWPGNLEAERVSVRLQEPAGASAIEVRPDLGAGADGPDGLVYRTRTLGRLEAGAKLPIEVSYTKRDSRTSTEIMGLKAQPAPAPQDARESPPDIPSWVFGLVSVTLVSMLAVGLTLWWYRRTASLPAARKGGERFCTRCGAGMAADHRFCAKCGARGQE